MASNEMLARWFIADQAKCGHYRLKGHAEADFWSWVASWAVCLDRPSDLGDYSDAGYDLPPLNLREEVVAVNTSERLAVDTGGQMSFVPLDQLTATSLHKEGKLTCDLRADRVAEIVEAEKGESWIVWCNTNQEADAVRSRIHGAVEVRGNEPDHRKEEKLAGFADGFPQVLVTKPSIAGWGLNWQHCARVAFVGLSWSHEQLFQAIRRCWRFGQRRPVECWVVCAETEGQVLAAINRKERQFMEQRRQLVAASRRTLDGSQGGRQLKSSRTARGLATPNWLTTREVAA